MVESYASCWRLQFKPSKCEYMVFSKQTLPKSVPQVTLDGRVIELVSYTKHLGTGVGAEDCVVQNMIKKGRKSFSAILSLGKNIGGTNPAVANKLHWSTVIPSMLYGIQVLCLSEEALDSLEQEHRAFGKRIQCIPTTTSNPAAYRLLGWKSIRAYRDLILC